jgi:hypothetical protein
VAGFCFFDLPAIYHRGQRFIEKEVVFGNNKIGLRTGVILWGAVVF